MDNTDVTSRLLGAEGSTTEAEHGTHTVNKTQERTLYKE